MFVRGRAMTAVVAKQAPEAATSADTDAILSLRGLWTSYGATTVLRDLSIDVARGDVIRNPQHARTGAFLQRILRSRQ